MARTLDELKVELDELLRHVREHGARLQRDIDVLKRRAEEQVSRDLPEDANGRRGSADRMPNE